VQRLRGSLLAAVKELDQAAGERSEGAITLERPPRAELGDYSSNAGLLLAPALGSAPRELAERLGEG